MQVKGSFFVARRLLITERFGPQAWDELVDDMARVDPVFARPILITTLLSGDQYIRFQEEICRRFFGGDENAYWTIGEAAAQWALTVGPYAQVARDGYVGLVSRLPLVWSMYFTEGNAEATTLSDRLRVRITGNTLPHISVELGVMGFVARALTFVGAKVLPARRVVGVGGGDGLVIHYDFPFDLADWSLVGVAGRAFVLRLGAVAPATEQLTAAVRAAVAQVHPQKAVFLADIRASSVWSPKDADILGDMLRHNNPAVERTAVLLSAKPTLALQVDRLLRGDAQRRAFEKQGEALDWLAAVLSPIEDRALRENVDKPSPERAPARGV